MFALRSSSTNSSPHSKPCWARGRKFPHKMVHACSQRGGPQKAVNVFLWELGWNLTPGGSACPHKGDCVHINITAASGPRTLLAMQRRDVVLLYTHTCKMSILDWKRGKLQRHACGKKMILLYHLWDKNHRGLFMWSGQSPEETCYTWSQNSPAGL